MDLQRGVYVEGATEAKVTSDVELLKLLQRGSERRHVADTNMNLESSRRYVP